VLLNRCLPRALTASGRAFGVCHAHICVIKILYGADKPNGTPDEDKNPTQQVNGYYAHTDGEMALFMNRGCHRKWSQAGRYLLVSGRIVSVSIFHYPQFKSRLPHR
jgi:hypothetical protein